MRKLKILLVILCLLVIAETSALLYINHSYMKNIISVYKYEDYEVMTGDFEEIEEIHKLKYGGTIIGYDYYLSDDGYNYSIIYEKEIDGWYLLGSEIKKETYITKYIKVDSGNIYELSNTKI